MALARTHAGDASFDGAQPPQRIDARRQPGKFGGKVVVVGDDDGQTAVTRIADGLRLGDAGVAGQQHIRRMFGQLLLELGQTNAVALLEAVGHVKAHTVVAGQCAQRGHQQRGARLPVHVEVAPNEEVLRTGDGVVKQVRSRVDTEQGGRRRRCVQVRIKKRQCFCRRVDAALRQQLHHQRMSADGGDQFRRWRDGWFENPGLCHSQARCANADPRSPIRRVRLYRDC
jgi:hypothetical protein